MRTYPSSPWSILCPLKPDSSEMLTSLNDEWNLEFTAMVTRKCKS